MSRRVVLALLVALVGVAGIVAGSLLLAADPPREGAGLGLLFAGVALAFVALGVLTHGVQTKAAAPDRSGWSSVFDAFR